MVQSYIFISLAVTDTLSKSIINLIIFTIFYLFICVCVMGRNGGQGTTCWRQFSLPCGAQGLSSGGQALSQSPSPTQLSCLTLRSFSLRKCDIYKEHIQRPYFTIFHSGIRLFHHPFPKKSCCCGLCFSPRLLTGRPQNA